MQCKCKKLILSDSSISCYDNFGICFKRAYYAGNTIVFNFGLYKRILKQRGRDVKFPRVIVFARIWRLKTNKKMQSKNKNQVNKRATKFS